MLHSIKLKSYFLFSVGVIALVVYGCSVSLGQTSTPGLAGPTKTSLLKHSDVAIWFDAPDDYLKYPNVDVIVQDLDITNELDLPKWKELVEKWHSQGKRFFAEVRAATPLGNTFETLMDDPGMREAACLDFNYNHITPSWQLTRSFRDQSLQFFCSNNPRYRAFLRYLIYLYQESGADGLFVDDTGGTPASFFQGGCFCPYCTRLFRDFLRDKYTPEQWKTFNLGDLNTFEYRKVILQYADDQSTLDAARMRNEIPLTNDFQEFLIQSDADFFQDLHAQIDKLNGKHVPMAWDNFNFLSARMPYYPTLDALAPETNFALFTVNGQGDNTLLPPAITLLNRVSDALGKWYSPIPAPPTWTVAKEKNLTGMLRLWVAATYANGGIPRYPRKGWCKGNSGRWYYPPKEAFSPLYDFVRSHRSLFDGYENVAQVGVIVTENTAEMSGSGAAVPLKHIAESLVNLNVPFGVTLAGENQIKQRLNPDDGTRFELLLIPESAKFDTPQQQLVEEWKNKGIAFTVAGTDNLTTMLKGRIEPLVALESKSDVWLFPRAVPGNKDTPVVCHVVNWNYNSTTNTTVSQKNVKVRIRTSIIDGAKVKKVIYHTVEKPEQSLDFVIRDNAIHLTVPEVELWGVLELQH